MKTTTSTSPTGKAATETKAKAKAPAIPQPKPLDVHRFMHAVAQMEAMLEDAFLGERGEEGIAMELDGINPGFAYCYEFGANHELLNALDSITETARTMLAMTEHAIAAKQARGEIPGVRHGITPVASNDLLPDDSQKFVVSTHKDAAKLRPGLPCLTENMSCSGLIVEVFAEGIRWVDFNGERGISSFEEVDVPQRGSLADRYTLNDAAPAPATAPAPALSNRFLIARHFAALAQAHAEKAIEDAKAEDLSESCVREYRDGMGTVMCELINLADRQPVAIE